MTSPLGQQSSDYRQSQDYCKPSIRGKLSGHVLRCYQMLWIGVGQRRHFLRPAGLIVGAIEIACFVRRKGVHLNPVVVAFRGQQPGVIARSVFEIELDDLRRIVIRNPGVGIAHRYVQRRVEASPGSDVFIVRIFGGVPRGSLLVHLDVAIVAVEHVEPVVRSDRDTMHAGELMRFGPFLAEFRMVGAVGVAHDDALVAESVGDEKLAVGQEGDILGLVVMRFVVAGDVLLAQGHQQFVAVVGKDIDDVAAFLDQPQAVLGIVGAHAQAMGARAVGARKQVIPVVPDFEHLAFAVYHVNTVLPGAAAPAQHVPAHGAGKVRVFRRNRIRQFGFAALQEEDAVAGLGIHSRVAAPGKSFFTEWLNPGLRVVFIRAWPDRSRGPGPGPGLLAGRQASGRPPNCMIFIVFIPIGEMVRYPESNTRKER